MHQKLHLSKLTTFGRLFYGEIPKVSLPKMNTLKEQAFGCHLTSIDICMFFYSIKLDQASTKFTNFYFNGDIFCHNGLPMGLASCPYIAQKVAE